MWRGGGPSRGSDGDREGGLGRVEGSIVPSFLTVEEFSSRVPGGWMGSYSGIS